MSQRIYLSPPHLSGEELEYVKKALDSNWVAPVGPAITEFESQLANFNSVQHCLAVSSGTAAIHLALIVLGVQDGDEVVCSTFTFSGSCNPIMYQSATPVFVDSETETWNMDPVLLNQAIEDRIRKGKKPKAIIVVDLFGMPAKMNEINAIARHYQISVVEDAAEALGYTYHGEKAGALGDIGIYSFNGNKIITTSGGGAAVSNKKEWIERARYLSSQSRSPLPYYEHEEVGYNYQLSNICASIGLSQMKALNLRIKQRRRIFEQYKSKLSDETFSFQSEPNGFVSNRWLTTMVVNSDKNFNEKIRIELNKSGIESRLLWKPMHLQPVFKHAPAYISGVSESLFRDGLCLPSGSGLSESQIDFIVKKIRSTAMT
jgi:dTDP-4-amino-4,6-dideoxygalactose transaminase